MKLRYQEEAPNVYNAGGYLFEPGDVREVPDGLGHTLLQRPWFQSAPDEDEDYDEGPTCAGKDGECTRNVEEEGAYCWQHEPDEDETEEE